MQAPLPTTTFLLNTSQSTLDLSDATEAFALHLRHDRPSTCRLSLSPDYLGQLGHGAELEVDLGGEPFTGTVLALDLDRRPGQATRLALTAVDALARLAGTVHERSWEEPTLAELVQTVAAAHGLRARVPSGSSELTPAWVMQRGDDLAFLVSLGAATGRRLFAEGDILVLEAEQRDAQPLELHLEEDLLAFELSEDLRRVPGAVRLGGRAPCTSSALSATLTQADLAAGMGFGPTLSAGLLGPRTTCQVHPLAQSADDAASVAGSLLTRAAAALVQGWIELEFMPELAPGREVLLAGVPGTVRLRVLEAHHLSDAEGTRTRLVLGGTHSLLTTASTP